MPVVLDSGPLIGTLNPKDPRRAEGLALMDEVASGRHGNAVVPAVVRMEALTFLRIKVQDRSVSRKMEALMDTFVEAPLTDEVLAAAQAMHFAQWDRRLSMTDCAVIEHARLLGASAATLDSHWDGLVELLRP